MNFMSFGESMNTGGFTQKTIKGDLIVRLHHIYPRRKLFGKHLEHIRRQPTEADLKRLTCGAGRPHLQAGRPMGPLVSLRFDIDSSTTIEDQSTPLLNVGSNIGTR